MNNLRTAQRAYDDMNEPEYHDFDSDPMFAEFTEFVAQELLAGRDWQNLSSEILMIDLEQDGVGHEMALEWVCDRVTEKQYRSWLDDLAY